MRSRRRNRTRACRDEYSAFYTRAAALFRDLALARSDGSFLNLLARLNRIGMLVIDDQAMAPLSEPERCDFWGICEDRYRVRSLILTSQLPAARWHEHIGDPAVADDILAGHINIALGIGHLTGCLRVSVKPNNLPSPMCQGRAQNTRFSTTAIILGSRSR
jgi:IstB-like ATP binding protein